MLRRARWLWVALGYVWGVGTGQLVRAEEVKVAAASHMATVMPVLAQAFAETHPEHHITYANAATGNLVAQIAHGAPFDVLLAADMAYPRAVIARGLAQESNLQVMGVGRLMLWPAPPAGTADWQTHLQSSEVRRIAIANPETAPIGRAARAALQAAGLWEVLRDKIVEGENVAHALQFVHSGNAQAGFVSESLLVGLAESPNGVPVEINDGGTLLAHGALLLNRGASNPGARTFMAWLHRSEAQTVLAAHGYTTSVNLETEVTDG